MVVMRVVVMVVAVLVVAAAELKHGKDRPGHNQQASYQPPLAAGNDPF